MTALEEMIAKQVQASMTMTVSRSADRLVDAMMEDILRDPGVRAKFVAIVLRAFERVWDDMQQERVS
jgi:hypothetical protein